MSGRGHQSAWWMPGLLAAGATGYLAWGAWVCAHNPAWLYRNNSLWRDLLRPDQGTLPVACGILWLITAIIFWWPRRRRASGIGLAVVAAMVAVGAVLGTASLAPCRGTQSPTAVFAWVLSLYVGSVQSVYQSRACPGQVPLALQLAQAVCLAATFTGALAAATALWQQPVARLRARIVKDATIVTGLDAMTIPLLECLTSTRKPSTIVVIEPDRNHPLLQQVRSAGAQLIIADPHSPGTLLPLVHGWRGPQLRYLFALRAETTDNEAVLAAAKTVLRDHRADPDRPPHLILRIDDPRQAEVWRGQHTGPSSWFEDALSPQESTARTLLDQVMRCGARRLVLCGDSTLALSVLLELARRTWEQRSIAHAQADGHGNVTTQPSRATAILQADTGSLLDRIIILDRRAADLWREFEATSPATITRAQAGVERTGLSWHDHLLVMLDALTPQERARTAVVITDMPSEAGLHEAGRVARLHPETQIFVLVSDGAGVGDAVFDKLRPFQRSLLADGQIPEDSWTRIARHGHEIYRLAHPVVADGKKDLTRRPWGELDEFVRQDNVLQLRSVMTAVAGLGRTWVPSRAVRPGSYVDLTDREIRQVAAQEHGRWYERRRRAGWRAPSRGDAGDDSTRVNANVRAWADLPEHARQQSCLHVLSLLAHLEAVGFRPALPAEGPAGAASYVRIGAVWAHQLDAAKIWLGTAGEEFSAQAGDWLVRDEFDTERTIRDSEFRASHIALGGDRWQRIGTVRAWSVDEPTTVHTMEGKAVAQAGDWIVQGPGGERWPIASDYLERAYVPIDSVQSSVIHDT